MNSFFHKDTSRLYHQREPFFHAAELFLADAAHASLYCIMAIDIDHFKLFNEWYGEAAGDEFLNSIEQFLIDHIQTNDGIAGHIESDNFALLMQNDSQKILHLQEQIIQYVKNYCGNAGFLPAFGIYEISEDSPSVSIMYDRASIALSCVKGNYVKRSYVYQDDMIDKMKNLHKLSAEIQKGFYQDEFIFYLQPQCDMRTKKIIGMEALIRWNHPTRGILSPGTFIPLLENNGFITNLDIYIWDKVCQQLRAWLDAGYHPVPISVNISRVDIFSIDIPKHFQALIKKYSIPPELLHIEITETSYAEEYSLITSMVTELQKSGFSVFMDDFGSGYSSLNMLQDVSINVLKIDMRFLNPSHANLQKSTGILAAIIRMARLMNLDSIAEGVETESQATALLEMGCRYAQGYYYYHPLPIAEAEALLKQEELLSFPSQDSSVKKLHLTDFLNENIFTETLISNLLGAIAVYDIYEHQAELLCINEQYQHLFQIDADSLKEHHHQFLSSLQPEDYHNVLRIFEHARKNPLNGAEGVIRKLQSDGSFLWLHLRAFLIREQDGHALFCVAVIDVSHPDIFPTQSL